MLKEEEHDLIEENRNDVWEAKQVEKEIIDDKNAMARAYERGLL